MLYKYHTGGNEGSVIGLFKRDGQEGYHYHRVIRIPDPPCRYDCASSEICFICSRCTTRESRSGRNRYVCILSSCACKSRCVPHRPGHFRYDGVSTPFISRAILLHEEASTKVTSGFETGCVFVDRSLSAAYVEQTGH